MQRKISIGPSQIAATLEVPQNYLEAARANGAPDDARIRIETFPSGEKLTVNVDYEDEVELGAGI